MTQAPLPPHDQDALHRRGLMFILSSPSGAGKTTIARKLLEAEPELGLSVSATTRPIRPGEVDGRDYHFIDQGEFDRMVEAGEFYEWAHVFGNSYGTPKGQIRTGLKLGQDFLFDIDWQGTQQLHQKAEADVVRVFILPPSLDELRRRLEGHRQRERDRRAHGARPGRNQPLGRL
jgi:guanylate kinase